MTIDVKETSTTRAIRYLRCRKIDKGTPQMCSQAYFAEDVYTRQLEKLLGCVELPAGAVELLRGKLEHVLGEEQHVYERLRAGLLQERDAVERRQQNLLVRSLDDNPRIGTARSLYERVRKELDEEHRRLTRELGRLKVRLTRIGRIILMALDISGCISRAFMADADPDYRGLIARVVFKTLHLRDGRVAGGTINDPLTVFRRWAGEEPMERLADLALLCAPNRTLVDGCRKRPKRHVSLSSIRRDMLRLQDRLTPEEEAEIESCYHELRGRGLLVMNRKPIDDLI